LSPGMYIFVAGRLLGLTTFAMTLVYPNPRRAVHPAGPLRCNALNTNNFTFWRETDCSAGGQAGLKAGSPPRLAAPRLAKMSQTVTQQVRQMAV
jgi:hypothetical protein